jgi:adenylate cyclase
VSERGASDDKPAPFGAADLQALRAYLVGLGATEEELAEAERESRGGSLALDLLLRSPGRRVPLAEAAAAADVPLDEAARFWRALGFPDPAYAPPMLGPDDVEALRLVGQAGSELLGDAAALGLARVVGTTTFRLAQALVDSFRTQYEGPQRAANIPYSEVVRNYGDVTRALLPSFLVAVGTIFRRHLVSVAAGEWTPDAEQGTTRQDLCVAFADLVGYTAWSLGLSSGALAELVNAFESTVGEAASDHGARVVKLIGDGAMLVAPGTGALVDVALDLVERVRESADLPEVRVGMAAGQVVTLHGDYYGDVVNLASRLASVAAPSTVVVSAEVRARLGDSLPAAPLPPASLKGFPAPTEAFVVSRP